MAEADSGAPLRKSASKFGLNNDLEDLEHKIPFKDRVQCVQCGIEFFLSARVLFLLTATIETVVVVTLSLASTLFFIYFRNFQGNTLAVKLDFSIMSIALVFPVTFLIQSGFARRERALVALSSLKADLTQLLLGIMIWSPLKNGDVEEKTRNNHERASLVFERLVQAVYSMKAVLQLPTSSRRRHFSTSKGQKFRTEVAKRARLMNLQVHKAFVELHHAISSMKADGMPGGEASRLEQYVYFSQTHFEQLLVIKNYRTPQGVRSFLRVFVVVIPMLLGPYFAWVYEESGLGVALVINFFTAYILEALISVHRNLEDPFCRKYFNDGQDLPNEFDTILESLKESWRAEGVYLNSKSTAAPSSGLQEETAKPLTADTR